MCFRRSPACGAIEGMTDTAATAADSSTLSDRQLATSPSSKRPEVSKQYGIRPDKRATLRRSCQALARHPNRREPDLSVPIWRTHIKVGGYFLQVCTSYHLSRAWGSFDHRNCPSNNHRGVLSNLPRLLVAHQKTRSRAQACLFVSIGRVG
jgi:hypothetical protein